MQHLKHRHLKMHRYISQQSFCCVCGSLGLGPCGTLFLSVGRFPSPLVVGCGYLLAPRHQAGRFGIVAGPQACGLKWFDLFVAWWGSRQVSGSSWAPRVLWSCSQLVLGGRLRLESAASCSWFSGAPAFWLWALHLPPPPCSSGVDLLGKTVRQVRFFKTDIKRMSL